jgi:CBS domain-containing protein
MELCVRLVENRRNQGEELRRLRGLLVRVLDAANPALVPVHTLDALLACLENAAAAQVETIEGLVALTTARTAASSPHKREPTSAAPLLRRLHSEHESMLGLLEFAARACSAFSGATDETTLHGELDAELKEWTRRERTLLQFEVDFLVPRVIELDPALGSDARPTVLPVHRRDVVSRTGHRHEKSVFCPAEAHSVDVEWCRTCPLVRQVDHAAVRCTPAAEPSELQPDAYRVAAGAVVGEILGNHHLSVLPNVTAGDIARALREVASPAVVVVDDEDHLVGIITPSDASSAPSGVQARELSREGPYIEESASLAEAVDRMVRAHVRFLPVVGADQRVIGVLADLDALRWVGSSRGRRPIG